MTARTTLGVFLGALPLCSLLYGCNSATETNDVDQGTPTPDMSSGTTPDLANAPQLVTFHYTPQYAGVTGVSVIGGFGMANDWSTTSPLLTLQNNGSGTYSGSVMLPPGQYFYLFNLTETVGANTATRLAIDPLTSAQAVCPAASPSYAQDPTNPCSQVKVPQGAPDPVVHMTGVALQGGVAVANYVAMVEREEPTEHHFFANQMTVKQDGSYDLMVAPGSYRIQLFPPNWFTMTDAAKNPLTLQTYRRALSVSTPINAATAMGTVDLAFTHYNQMLPQSGTQTLPVTLNYPVPAGISTVMASVYGTKNGTGMNIGDPWWDGANSNKTSASFDGTFTTPQKLEPKVVTGEQYYWGIWLTPPALPSGIQWRYESLVFPIKF